MTTRPALRWHGGKWNLAPWVIGFFPPQSQPVRRSRMKSPGDDIVGALIVCAVFLATFAVILLCVIGALVDSVASGTEAQRATTAQTGVVHDGPTGKAGDAQ